MTRIAVLGANGQVGAELCAILARLPGVEVVPVCRNRFGSAYLRSIGIACRHGQPASPEESAALYGDCDVVANLALVSTLRNPSAARAINRQLIENVASHMGARGGRHIYFSTMSVYGDQEVGDLIPFANLYGAEKRASEGIALKAGRRAGCGTYVFRLGNVCGELQGITKAIRSAIATGVVRLPDPARGSNSTYIATIVDAILQVAAGAVPVGTYDLMNSPQWSWREVFDYEAGRMSMTIRHEPVPDRSTHAVRKALRGTAASLVRWILGSPVSRKVGGRLVGYLPYEAYRRFRARYAIISAAADIASLRSGREPVDATYRKPIMTRQPPNLRPTAGLLKDPRFVFTPEPVNAPWPPDLPMAQPRR